MKFPIKFYTVKSGWSIVYIEGSQVIISKKYCILLSEDLFTFTNNVNPDEMQRSIMLHFIRVRTVCQSTHLGVSGPQRVNKGIQ